MFEVMRRWHDVYHAQHPEQTQWWCAVPITEGSAALQPPPLPD
jgi:hypothetical protein